MRYPKLRELKEAIRSLFSPPYTIKFPKRPSIPAARFRGAPEYFKEDCVGCGACSEVCPSSTIEITDDLKTKMRTLTLRLDSCLFCGNCQANCITQKGIMLSSCYDTATYDRTQAIVSVQKELLVCEHCECVIGAKDHIKFLAKKLGILAYGNSVMILANQCELKLNDADSVKKQKIDIDFNDKSYTGGGYGRSAIFRILCPRCRRAVMLEDEYG